jgi:hypothetical protein
MIGRILTGLLVALALVLVVGVPILAVRRTYEAWRDPPFRRTFALLLGGSAAAGTAVGGLLGATGVAAMLLGTGPMLLLFAFLGLAMDAVGATRSGDPTAAAPAGRGSRAWAAMFACLLGLATTLGSSEATDAIAERRSRAWLEAAARELPALRDGAGALTPGWRTALVARIGEPPGRVSAGGAQTWRERPDGGMDLAFRASEELFDRDGGWWVLDGTTLLWRFEPE